MQFLLVFTSTESCDRTESRLVRFFFEIANLKKYPILGKIMEMILRINHGQADIERGFSVKKNLVKDIWKKHP